MEGLGVNSEIAHGPSATSAMKLERSPPRQSEGGRINLRFDLEEQGRSEVRAVSGRRWLPAVPVMTI